MMAHLKDAQGARDRTCIARSCAAHRAERCHVERARRDTY